MRFITTKQCRPGMKLGKSILSEDGRVLLNANVELNQNLIQRLQQYGIEHLYIQDSLTDDVIIPEMISSETRVKAVSAIRTHFRNIMDESLRKRGASQMLLGKDFRQVMSLIIDDLSQNKDAMIMLMDMHVVDHYLYQHSLNVCIYSTMLGMAHGYSKEELMTLGLGALLHDIGKTKVPADVLLKPGKLSDTEFDLMKKHAEYGYKMLKDEPNIPLLSAHCAFQHHERLNGSGYPRGIQGSEIHDFARWIGLVDSYDAMTSHRVYRSAMLPHQAVEVLYAGTDTLYDQKKIELFRDKVAIYPLGVTVGLNTGECGVVVDINTAFPQRPVVRIFQDADGQEIRAPYEIDLSKKLSIAITSVNDMSIEQRAMYS